MISVEYERGKEIVGTCTCECGAGLTLAWGGSWGIESYVLKCTKDINHCRIARPASLGPYDIPGFNLFNLKGRRKEMEQELGKEKTTRLMKYEGVVSLTQQGATEVLETIWPDAPEVEVFKAAMVCHQYGLNPLMKHLFLIPFKRRRQGKVVGEDWVTVLGIKATRLIAHRHGDFSYLDDTPRVMTEEEQKRIYGYIDKNKIMAITKLKDSKGNEASGYGAWPLGEEPYGAEKGNTKANMAFIRSERNALDRLFAGEMPQGIQVVDEEYISGGVVEGEVITPSKGGGEIGEAAGEELGEGVSGSTISSSSKKAPEPQKIEASAAEGEGFSIDLDWLKESQRTLKWTDDTTLTFIIGQYKVSGTSVTGALKLLTREQAEDFVAQINKRLEKQASLF